MYIVCPFLSIVLSVLLRFTDSDFPLVSPNSSWLSCIGLLTYLLPKTINLRLFIFWLIEGYLTNLLHWKSGFLILLKCSGFPDCAEANKTPIKVFGLEHCVLVDNTFCTPYKLSIVVHSHPRALSCKYLKLKTQCWIFWSWTMFVEIAIQVFFSSQKAIALRWNTKRAFQLERDIRSFPSVHLLLTRFHLSVSSLRVINLNLYVSVCRWKHYSWFLHFTMGAVYEITKSYFLNTT